MTKPVIYIAGPYRAATEWEVEQNIQRAEAAALRLWKAGWVVICPHMNTDHFGGACPDETWLEGDLELLRRSDAVYMLVGWTRSAGARAELDEAIRLGKGVHYERKDEQPVPATIDQAAS